MKILVLEKYADRYPPHLQDLGAEVHYATSLDQAESHYDVLLAQPDLAADYLKNGGVVDWIQSTWAGVTPLTELKNERLPRVTGVKNVFGAQMAEYILTYILEELRQPERHRAAQQDRQWRPSPPASLTARHMVILGTGSIGSHVATVARAFGLRVTGVSRSGRRANAFDAVFPVGQLAHVVADADYLVAVLPDTEDTRGAIHAEIFAAMQNKPLLFNVGRGSTLHEPALLAALAAGQLRGAVLDVFDTEPLPQTSPLWSAPGVVITPHIAAFSHAEDIAAIFRSNLKKYTRGEPLAFELDLSRGY